MTHIGIETEKEQLRDKNWQFVLSQSTIMCTFVKIFKLHLI